MGKEGWVVERAGKRSAVIASGPFDIVHMSADEVWRNGFQPFPMIEETQIVFELHMTEVVPIADPRVVFEMFLKFQHFAFVGHVFET